MIKILIKLLILNQFLLDFIFNKKILVIFHYLNYLFLNKLKMTDIPNKLKEIYGLKNKSFRDFFINFNERERIMKV